MITQSRHEVSDCVITNHEFCDITVTSFILITGHEHEFSFECNVRCLGHKSQVRLKTGRQEKTQTLFLF